MYNGDMRKKVFFSLMILFAIIAVALFLGWLYVESEKMKVVFFDVGQGDAILITQGSQQVLIDGGKDGKVLLEHLGREIPFWDRNIEAVIVTHPDQDHLGGLVSLLRSYDVQSVIEGKGESNSKLFETWNLEKDKEKVEQIKALGGMQIKFANGANLEIVSQDQSDVKKADTNSASVVSRLLFGNDSFLFMGDFPMEKEKELLGKNHVLESKVLKVSHHGSKYATSDEFLAKVKPLDAVISVGKSNSYGHPDASVLERLKMSGARILRTDEMGDIKYFCSRAASGCVLAPSGI